jgi:SPOR domain
MICGFVPLIGLAQVQPLVRDTSKHIAAITDTSKHLATVRDTTKLAPIAIIIPPTPPAPDSSVHVDAPALVRNVVQKLYDYQRYSHCTSPGFRVQIDFSQERSSVNNTKSNFTIKYPGMSSYVSYKQPYFRVSVGDFRSRLQASRFLNTVKKDYPAAFIVADRITLPPLQ